MQPLNNYFIKKLALNQRLDFLEKKKRLYESLLDEARIIERQIRNFNEVWKRCYETIPFYTHWRNRHDLPARISGVSDLRKFPLLTKRTIQENHNLIFQNGKLREYVSTGGSTGDPTRFPSSSAEVIPTYADLYVGRSWYDIQPLDCALIFWGHSHLFGAGWKGVLNDLKRKTYDRMVNVRRLNAYDMSVETIEKYFNFYRRSNPSFILGYTSCVYKLAKYICEHRVDCGKKDKLKAVIVTSEAVTMSDIELVSKAFGVPVAIEYGMAETGAIAYSRNTPSNIQVFWDSFLAVIGSSGVLNITTLYDKLFPLINYHTEDVVGVSKEAEGSVLSLCSIHGRRQEILKIGTIEGTTVELNGILMVHILKSYPHIFSIQFEQLEPGRVRLSLVADRQLNLEHIKDYFLREIRKDHKTIDANCIDIDQVRSISKTMAGKERLVS